MLWRVDFIQGKTDAPDYNQVKHSLEDTITNRAIISLSVSADKLQGVSNYTREPRRMTFECIPTEWINDNILSGSNEHERYISHFEVKAYRDGELVFSGIIDTSQLSYDVSTGILKFLCYDKIRLFYLFSDLTHYYSISSGYLPHWLLGYYIQDIQAMIPVNIPYISILSIPDISVPMGDPISISQIDYSELLSLPSGGGYTYSIDVSSFSSPKFGYILDLGSNRVIFAFAHYIVIEAARSGLPSQYKARMQGGVYVVYNKLCVIKHEYDRESAWSDVSDFSNEYNEFMAFYTRHGVSPASLDTLSSTALLSGAAYSTSHWAGHSVEALVYGSILPTAIHPGKSYEIFTEEQTSSLRTLQAMMMLYNATLIGLPNGVIQLASKTIEGSIVEISNDSVVSMRTRRANPEVPDTSVLDVLAGNADVLRSLVTSYLMDYHDSRWSSDIIIDNLDAYDINLFSRVRIDGNVYRVISVERDYQADEYILTGWKE